MMQPAATDPTTLPDPVLEHVLALGVRLTGRTLCQPGRSIDAAARMLTPYLDTLPRNCVPQVSLAVILACPWIDANVASLTNNLWLLDTLTALTKGPYWRPLQYDDTHLLDKVSGTGFIQVLEWWHTTQNDFIIGHDNPLKAAGDAGHVHVMDWWLQSGRLDKDFAQCCSSGVDLLEPTRKGDMAVLDWWTKHVLETQLPPPALKPGKSTTTNAPNLFTHSFAEAIWVALQAQRDDLVEWWVSICRRYSGISSMEMSALFASGNAELVAKYWSEFSGDDSTKQYALAYAAVSGDVAFIGGCLDKYLGKVSNKVKRRVYADMFLYASCAGHVYVLDYLKTKSKLQLDTKDMRTIVCNNPSPLWIILPKGIVQDATEMSLNRLCMLEIVAHQGHLSVFQWWSANNQAFFLAAVHDRPNLMPTPLINLAVAQNHLALLDWLLPLAQKDKLLSQYYGTNLAATRGHLEAFQWFVQQLFSLGVSSSVVVHTLYQAIDAALVAAQFHLIDWLMDYDQGSMQTQVLEIASGVMRAGLYAHIAEWWWRNTHRFSHDAFGDEIMYGVFDDNPEDDSRIVTAQDLWTVLCMEGAQATTAAGETVTFKLQLCDDSDAYDMFSPEDFDKEDAFHRTCVLHSWRGRPLFLERLAALATTLDMYTLEMRVNLDEACDARAGVAVLDWMHGSSIRIGALGRCKFSRRGYRHLVKSKCTAALQWWNKCLPESFPKGVDGSDGIGSDSDDSDDEHATDQDDDDMPVEYGDLYDLDEFEHFGPTFGPAFVSPDSASMHAQYLAMLAEDPAWTKEWLDTLNELQGGMYPFGYGSYDGYESD